MGSVQRANWFVCKFRFFSLIVVSAVLFAAGSAGEAQAKAPPAAHAHKAALQKPKAAAAKKAKLANAKAKKTAHLKKPLTAAQRKAAAAAARRKEAVRVA